MKKLISVLMICAMMLSLLPMVVYAEEKAPSAAYTDLIEGSWYYNDVNYVLEKGLMVGVGQNQFSPAGPTTRAMMVAVLYRQENSPAVEGELAFTDVGEGMWYTDAVKWAVANGIAYGYGNGIFAPNSELTREQLASFLYRYARYKNQICDGFADLSVFEDSVNVSDWAKEAMAWACGKGIIYGVSQTTLAPKSGATRIQLAAVIARYDRDVYIPFDRAIDAATEKIEEVIAEGGKVVVTEDIAIKDTITITKDTELYLDGKLDASSNASRPFEIADGASLVIHGGKNTVVVGKYGLVNIPATAKESTLVLNGGIYEGNTDNGAFIKLRPGADHVTIELNDVEYTDSSDDGFIMNCSEFSGQSDIIINGGRFTANAGFQATGKLEIRGAEIITAACAFEIAGGDALFEKCMITVDPGRVVGTAPAAAIAASSGGKVNVKNCTIKGTMHAAYEVYPTSGSIKVSDTDVSEITVTNDAGVCFYSYPEPANNAFISINDIVVVNQTK